MFMTSGVGKSSNLGIDPIIDVVAADPTSPTITPILLSTIANIDSTIESLNQGANSLRAVVAELSRKLPNPGLTSVQFNCATSVALAPTQPAVSKLAQGLRDATAALYKITKAQEILFTSVSTSSSTIGSLVENMNVALTQDQPLPTSADLGENNKRSEVEKALPALDDLRKPHYLLPANFQPFLLPDGNLQLSGGNVLTKYYRLIRPDGSNRTVPAEAMRQLRDGPRVAGFTLPSGPDSESFYSGHDESLCRSKCDLCWEEVARGDCISLHCEEGCQYCVECLNQAFRASMKNRALFSLRCPCNDIVEFLYMADYYDRDIHHLAKQIPEEWKAKNPTFCGRKGCGTFIPAAQFLPTDSGCVGFGTCKACDEITCGTCKQTQTSHKNLCGKCPRTMLVPPDLYSFIKENRLTSCPGCETFADLEDGCSMILCYCGTTFCFICGARSDACKCSYPTDENFLYPNVYLDKWTTKVASLESELEVTSWPAHEKVIGDDAGINDENETTWQHLQAVAARGDARCHGCLKIFNRLKRCFECQIELCVTCRPQWPNYDLED